MYLFGLVMLRLAILLENIIADAVLLNFVNG
jgi:hypothetical protein